MRFETRVFAAAALAAVLLTGCTATAEPQPDATGPEGANSPTATAPTEAAPAAQGNVEPVITGVWAGVKYNQFLETTGDTYSGECGDASTPAGLRACAPFEPFAYVSAVESPAPGDLLVTVTPEAWGGGEYDPEQVFTLEYVAGNMALRMAHHDDDVKTLTVTTPDGSHTYTDHWQPHYASVLGS
jgi:hypothetical protein